MPIRDSGESQYVDDALADELIDADKLRPTPDQHEQLKTRLHGELLERIRRTDRRYLVIGRGERDLGERRRLVRDLLDERRNASAFLLEDFGFGSNELALWVPAFEVLSEVASHIVGVIEDFDGGHVWELGYLYHYQTRIRDVLWLLKRLYGTEEEMRSRYDNGMAASHLAVLETAVADRVIPWEQPNDLPSAVASIP